MALIVQKYGGTSVGTVERICEVAKRVASYRRQGHRLVVVVSAMAGETNRLLDLARHVARLTVGRRAWERADLLASRADDELADAADEVGPAARSLRREALVVVVVSDEDELGVRVVQRLPEGRVRRITSVRARREPRVVPVGERAARRMRDEIRA